MEVVLYWLKKIPWSEVVLILTMILIDIAIHPLTYGPDRYIHDPAVYRIESEQYLSGDWYTEMATESGVYVFYAPLIQLGDLLLIPEEVWRQGLYLMSLAVLFYSILQIVKMFLPSIFGVFTIIFLHAYLMINIPPPWLYGPFMQIDGGLAPRTIGVALSFLALFLLLKKARILPWIILGAATLIHVSNSLIVFGLLIVSYAVWCFFKSDNLRDVVQEMLVKTGVYLASGGWFAFFVAIQSNGLPEDFTLEKFIWIWIYFRASYMALPLVSFQDWMYFFAHIASIIGGWVILWKYGKPEFRENLNLLSIVGLGAAILFFAFYVFAFVWPWLPGFQFYSLRVIYFTYFIAYLYFGSVLFVLYQLILSKSIWRMQLWERSFIFSCTLVLSVISMNVIYTTIPQIVHRAEKNFAASWERFLNSNPVSPKLDTERYIVMHPEPFISPPDWYASPRHSTPYVPSATSFKSFGFTPAGAFQWFERMDDMSRGELQQEFEKQKQKKKWKPTSIQWNKYYSQFTADEICVLSRKYSTKLFLTYQESEYPFPLVVGDTDFRLYRTGQCF